MNNNNLKILKIKVEPKTYNALAKIINKNNKTIQSLIEELLKNYIYENIDLIVGGE